MCILFTTLELASSSRNNLSDSVWLFKKLLIKLSLEYTLLYKEFWTSEQVLGLLQYLKLYMLYIGNQYIH